MENNINDLMNSHTEPSINQYTSTQKTTQPVGNHYLDDPQEGLKLCASLIANSKHTGKVAEYQAQIKAIIEQQFLQHAEHDENTSGAKTYAELLQWQQHLAEAISFPQLEKSYTVAVGGSFSAGKTRFLTTVLGCPSLLPIDTTPTTSIPTYLFQGIENSIEALNFYAKKTAIDEAALKAICHSFYDRYKVTFSHLLQLIAVQRQTFVYPNLIFLDTPGYSKADNISHSEQNTDENIARAHLRNADYLIWLVDQQNGTVPKPDIDFIQALDLQQPVLVVISKADKRPESQIREVIKTAKQDLQRADINYLDVIAYSSQNQQEISETGNQLETFLKDINQGKNGSTILWQLEQIFKKYSQHFDSKQQVLRLTNKTINELIFDESISQDKRNHLSDFQKKTKAQIDALHQQKKETEKIVKNLGTTVETLCKTLGINLTTQPSMIQLQGIRKKQTQSTQAETVTFEALLQGKLTTLSNQAGLTKLDGNIVKKSAIGLVVSIYAAPSLEIVIMQQQLKKKLTTSDDTNFQMGMPVKVQIINSKTCTVSIEI